MQRDSRVSPPASRPTTGRTGPAAPSTGGGASALAGADLSQKSIMELQQVLGNQGVADLIGERAGVPEKLDEPTRKDMEARFGEDFSGVEVHAGREAAKEAGRRGAEAYTTGERIVFGSGAYDPASERGRELIGHELAHVVQQRQGAPADRTTQAAEQEAERAGRGDTDKVREPAGAGAVQARESPLADTEMSDDAAELLHNIRDAAGQKWQDFDEWWSEHKSSALAKVEEQEDSGDEYSQVTMQLEMELKDTFREAAEALSRAASRMREVNPQGAQQLQTMITLLQGNAYLQDRDAKGMGKLLETIRLFFSFKQIEDTAEKLRRIDVTDSPRLAGVHFDRLFTDLAALGERVPGGVADYARVVLDLNRSGFFFPDAEGLVAPDDEEYRRMWEEFRKLD